MAKIVELEKQLMQRNKELDVIRVSGMGNPGWIRDAGKGNHRSGAGESSWFPVLSLGQVPGGIIYVCTQRMDRNPFGCARNH